MISVEKTSSGLIVAGNTRMIAATLVGGSDQATLEIKDAITDTGSVLLTIVAAANTTEFFSICLPGVKASSGLYAKLTGTSPKAYIVYR